MLRGEELSEDIDEKSGFEIAAAIAPSAVAHASSLWGQRGVPPVALQTNPSQRTVEVAYNAAIPIETFDCR